MFVTILDLEKNTEILSIKNLQGLVPFAQVVPLPKPRVSPAGEAVAVAEDSSTEKEAKESAATNEAEESVLAKSVERYLKGRVDLARSSPTLMNAVSYQDMRPFYASRRPITID